MMVAIKTKDDGKSESESSNTALIVGSTIGVVGILAGVAVVLMRGRNSEPTIGEQMAMESQMPIAQPNPVAQSPMIQPATPVQPECNSNLWRQQCSKCKPHHRHPLNLVRLRITQVCRPAEHMTSRPVRQCIFRQMVLDGK